ncbi:MAG: DNA polymerase, partial [Chloroflexota bacterium]|nr:DNA polymerase [Chloroflexota bacterium]
MDSKQMEGSSQGVAEAPGLRPKLLLVDGHALVYRAYHALPPDLRTSSGEATNAVLGFTQMMLDTLRNQVPKYGVVTFDKGRTFRHEASADYKAQRGPMPDDLRDQMSRVRQVVEALGLPIVELAGYEADDLIGTLAKEAEEKGLDTYILTADTDQHQLVTEHVYMIAPGGWKQRFSDAKIYDRQAVLDRYGFEPTLVPDYKALVGDKTDNIPNVPGVGEKTATALLVQYGSLEGIYRHLDELKPKVQESLRAHAEQARQSKELATIVRDAPVSLDLEKDCLGGFDKERLLKLLQELEFRSLVPKVNQVEALLGGGPQEPAQVQDTSARAGGSTSSKPGSLMQRDMFSTEVHEPEQAAGGLDLARRSPVSALSVEDARVLAGVPLQVFIITDREALGSLVEQLRQVGRFTVDVEATSTDDMDAQLVGISLTPATPLGEVEQSYYIPVGHLDPEEKSVSKLLEPQLSLAEVREVLAPLMADFSVLKDAHNSKYDMKVLGRAGLPVDGLGCDTMIAAYLVGETGISLKDLAFTKLGIQMVPISELIGKGRTQITMDQVPVHLSASYAGADVAITERLRHEFTPRLESQGLLKLFTDIEMPLVSVLADMEMVGVAIDVPGLQGLSTTLHKKMEELQADIYVEAKHPFNINSPSQLGTVLFEELQLPGRKRTQTGYSTDREVLDSLRGLHPIVDLVVEQRQLYKLKNTYIDALPLLVRRDTGRVHTSFNQTVASTGRLSSSQPNLQNIPIRTEIGR